MGFKPRPDRYCVARHQDNLRGGEVWWWERGPFRSAKEARRVIKEEGLGEEYQVHRVAFVRPSTFMPSVNSIMEDVDSLSYDEGMHHDGSTCSASDPDKAQRALDGWADKHLDLGADMIVGPKA